MTKEPDFNRVERVHVQHVAPGEQLTAVHPGDFILTHGGEFFSQLIRFGQQLRFHGTDNRYTYWNHVALIVSTDGDIIEALGVGVLRRKLVDYDPTQYTVVHLDIQGHDQAEVIAFAQSCVGLPYGWPTVASIAISLALGTKISFGFPGQMICSGLVARALERTTAIFEQEPSHIMPAELAKLYSVEPPTGVAKGQRARHTRASQPVAPSGQRPDGSAPPAAPSELAGLEFVWNEGTRLIQAQLRDGSDLDAKTAPLIGFSGAFLILVLSQQRLLGFASALLIAEIMLVLAFLLLSFWTKKFDSAPALPALVAWANQPAPEIRRVFIDALLVAYKQNQESLRRKVLFLRIALAFMAVLLATTGILVLGTFGAGGVQGAG